MKSLYLRSILLLTSGSMLGQVIGFVGSMIMTRIYTASEIGIMTTVVSFSGIFAPVIMVDLILLLLRNEGINIFLLWLNCLFI